MGKGKLTDNHSESGWESFLSNYRKAQKVIEGWRNKQAGKWDGKFVPHPQPPFFTPENIPQEPCLELAELLLESNGRQFSRKKLIASLQDILADRQVQDEELGSLLQLTLNAALAFARESLPASLMKLAQTEEGYTCPVCGQETALTILTPPVGKRYHHCTRCGMEWAAKRLGCIYCDSEKATDQTYLQTKDFPDAVMAVCANCGERFKELDLRKNEVNDFFLEDLRTLALNYAAEKWQSETQGKRLMN